MTESARSALLTRAIEFFAVTGIGDTSLRGIAAGVGTSHRMLIHHFGSREGLLQAVVERVEAEQRELLATLLADQHSDPVELGRTFWRATTDAALIYGPLLFELSAQAMQQRPHALPLRSSLINDWLEPLATLWTRRGLSKDRALRQARLDLAVARGLLQDLLLTGDRAAVDNAMDDYIAAVDNDAH
ncbi:MAG: TetR/AcrR family transcriptional regulator [Actinomycetota bacterium]|nr:TetR/AcrR family transcriptional regulator [Actinomycetota bacterium]